MWNVWERRENAWISLASKILVGRHRCQLGDNIKMCVREIGNKSVDWIDLVLGVVRRRALTAAMIKLGFVTASAVGLAAWLPSTEMPCRTKLRRLANIRLHCSKYRLRLTTSLLGVRICLHLMG